MNKSKHRERAELEAEKAAAEQSYELAVKANKPFTELKNLRFDINRINIALEQNAARENEFSADHEEERLEALDKYNILDTLTEKDYDDITFLAGLICDVPVSLISFVDKTRQWFKSHHGVETTETLREYAFCTYALNTPHQPLVVNDSRLDDRFKDNPLVTGAPNVVFYAGHPLTNKEGYVLGTVCVIDTKPRELNKDQLKALKILSSQVMHLLELRRKHFELQEQLVN